MSREQGRISLRTFSDKAVRVFIRFLYGYELDHENINDDMELVKELITIGGLLNIASLERAAASYLLEHFPREPLVEILDFVKTVRAREAGRLCAEFIRKKFERSFERNSTNSSKIFTKSIIRFPSSLIMSFLTRFPTLLSTLDEYS